MENYGIESANINLKWIENIYDNIKKIEEYERLAREGCSSILEYVQYPVRNRNVFLCDIQYKNLRMLLNEFILIIPDIVPVIGDVESQKFMDVLNRIKDVIDKRELFIEEYKSNVTKTIDDAKMTMLFSKSLDALSTCRIELIKLVKHILYMEESNHGRSRSKGTK